MATTSILPLQLGQAVLGRATEPDAPPPEYLRINGECWKLVTDPAAVQAAKDALEARERADDAFAMAQFAPRIANRPPTPADAEGKGPGAGWLEYDPATQLLRQMWRWDGAEWLALPMDPVMIPVIQIGTGTAGDLTADRLIVTSDFVARVAQILELSVENLVVTEGATINELVAVAIAGATAEFQQAYVQNLRSNGAEIDDAVIGVLASNIITSGLFRTAEAGQRLEIDSNGLVMWGVDEEGLDYEMVRLGPSGENLLTIGSTVVSNESVSSPTGQFDELIVGGDSISDTLNAYGQGVVAFAHAGYSSAWHGTNTDLRRLEATATLQPNRRYRITIDQHYVQLRSASSMQYVEMLRATIDGVYQDIAEARFTLEATTVEQTVGSLVGWATASSYTEPSEARFGLIVRGPSGRDHRIYATSSAPLRITVEDVGPTLVSTGNSFMDEGTPAEGTASAPPKEPSTTRYKNTWSAASYGGDVGAGEVIQGQYSRFGNRSGSWRFSSSMMSALSGSTIEKFEIYLYASHWYYGAGGTASIRSTTGGYQAFTGGTVTSAKWPRGAGRWVTIPKSWYAAIAAGTYKGMGVQTSSTSLAYYGRFTGSKTRFRATYVK